jgi:nitrate reductase alpha subunit
MYVDINPRDAHKLGIANGDYVWVDGDPAELPFRGWNDPARKAEYKVARLLVRARYYPGTPQGITRMWFNGYMATPGTVMAHEGRADGAAKNAETHYQAMFRYGGHQSLTRSWLKPTHQTQTLITRRSWTNEITRGFNVDVHCVTSAPKESLARFAKAEDGGIGGKGPWRPVALGLTPADESAQLKQHLAGGFVKITKT